MLQPKFLQVAENQSFYNSTLIYTQTIKSSRFTFHSLYTLVDTRMIRKCFTLVPHTLDSFEILVS